MCKRAPTRILKGPLTVVGSYPNSRSSLRRLFVLGVCGEHSVQNIHGGDAEHAAVLAEDCSRLDSKCRQAREPADCIMVLR